MRFTVRDTGNDKVFAMRRQQGKNTVDVVVNRSGAEQRYTFSGAGKDATIALWGWKLDTSGNRAR